MGFKFNPLAFSGFDLTSAGGPGYVLPPVPDEASLPASATDGFHIVVLDTDHIYVYDATASKWVDTGLTAASFGIVPNANGYTLQKDASGSIVRNKLILQPADATNPGGVSTTTQTFAGDKTFNDDVTVQGDLNVNGTLTYINTTDLEVKDKNIIINKGGLTVSTGNAGLTIEGNGAPVGYAQTSADRNKWELKAPGQAGVATINPGATGITLDQSSHDPVTLATVGSSPNGNAASLSNQQLTLQPADGTNPGVLTAGTQTIGGAKTFSDPVTATVNYSPTDPTDWNSPAPTTVAGGLDALADRIIQQDLATKEPTGFVNRTSSTLSFDDNTREFTITPVGSYDFYIKGQKFTKSAPVSITLPASDGDHYIYFDGTGSLTSTQVFSTAILQDYAFVSIVYWNTETNKHSYFAEERHGLTMDGATHTYLHTVLGARYLSGLALQNFSPTKTGAIDADAQFTSDSGSIRDEDILHTILAQSQIPILYRQGQLWRKKAADAFPVIYSGTAGYTGANGLLPYNQYTGGAWQLTQVTNSKYVLVHFFGTNDIDNPVVGIQGIAAHNSIEDARTAANSEITSLSGLPFAEFVPIGSVCFQTSTSFANTPKATVVVTNGGDYVDFRGTQLYTPAGNATTHSLLSGLSNDDHIQYLLVDGTRPMSGNLNLNTKDIVNVSNIYSNDPANDPFPAPVRNLHVEATGNVFLSGADETYVSAENTIYLESYSGSISINAYETSPVLPTDGKAYIYGQQGVNIQSGTRNLDLDDNTGIRLFELGGYINNPNTSLRNYAKIQAPSSLSADYTLTLPTDVATTTNSALVSDTSGNLSYVKVSAASSGDIAETSFTAADNQAVAANVTGLAFSNAVVRAFDAQVSIVRDGTYAVYKLRGIQKASSWEMTQDYIGDATGITFSITTAGQVQYTSTSTGFTSTIKFRAQTLSV